MRSSQALRAAIGLMLAVLLLHGSCASHGLRPDDPAFDPCEDPEYLRLKSVDPAVLTSDEWMRLSILEDQCEGVEDERDHGFSPLVAPLLIAIVVLWFVLPRVITLPVD